MTDNAQWSKRLAQELLQVVKTHYLRRPMDRDTVMEVLDALAFASASTLRGTANHYKSQRDRFINNMDETVRDLGGPAEGATAR